MTIGAVWLTPDNDARHITPADVGPALGLAPMPDVERPTDQFPELGEGITRYPVRAPFTLHLVAPAVPSGERNRLAENLAMLLPGETIRGSVVVIGDAAELEHVLDLGDTLRLTGGGVNRADTSTPFVHAVHGATGQPIHYATSGHYQPCPGGACAA